MWRRTAILVALGCTLSVDNASHAQQASAPATLVARLDWARFEVVMGRITVTNLNCTQKRNYSVSREQDLVRECLSLNICATPSLHYELSDPSAKTTLDVVNGNQVTLVRMPLEGSSVVPLRYHQPHVGPVSLRVGDDQQEPQTAATLWHLLLDSPELCQSELVPLLEIFRHNWQLSERTHAIKQALIAAAGRDDVPTRKQLQELVDQLGSPAFQRRQQADVQLRRLGLPVLSFLEQVDNADLDAEQRTRIRRIRRSLMVGDSDTSQRVAMQLLGDKAVWLILMSDVDLRCRQVAAAQLSRLCERRIDFSPGAEENTRIEQITGLRLRLLSQK